MAVEGEEFLGGWLSLEAQVGSPPFHAFIRDSGKILKDLDLACGWMGFLSDEGPRRRAPTYLRMILAEYSQSIVMV